MQYRKSNTGRKRNGAETQERKGLLFILSPASLRPGDLALKICGATFAELRFIGSNFS
jgi:hypothetical protein